MGEPVPQNDSSRSLEPHLDSGTPAWHPAAQAAGVAPADSRLFERAARREVPILVSGEIGCGKQLAARSIHAMSPRAEKTLIVIGCERSSEHDLEEDLCAALSQAKGGTLILEAAGRLPKALQLTLARTLDEGSLAARPAVRCIALSTRNAEELLSCGALRAELYYHLSTVEIRLPPLRERRAELPGMVAETLARIARRTGSARRRVAPTVMEHLLAHSWPGNLRELNRALERACLLAEAGTILPQHLSLEPARPQPNPPLRPLVEVERAEIVRTLAAMQGNRRRTAASLGIGLRTLYDKIKRYGIRATR